MIRWTSPFTSWSFNRRLVALLLVIFLPAVGIMLATGLRERREEIRQAQTRAAVLVESLAAQQEQIAAATKTLLSTLAQLPEVRRRDAVACNRLFQSLRSQHPLYAMIGAAAPDGTVFAASIPLAPGPHSLADRKHIQDAIRTRQFSVGEYIVGRLSNALLLSYTFPVLDARQNVTAILIASFRLDEYARFIAKIDLAPGDSVTVADWKGVRLYRVPATETTRPGKALPPEMVSRISGGTAQGLYERTGEDGVARVYAYRQVRLNDAGDPPYVYMIAGMAKAPILARAGWRMLMNVGIVGLAAGLAILLAWWTGYLGFVYPTSQLVAATERLARGDLTTRTGLLHTQDELGRLAAAFDDMAGLLETRSRDRALAEQALSAAYAELEARVEERTEALSTMNAQLLAENAERRQAEATLRFRTAQLEAVRELNTELTRELDLTRLLGLIVEQAARLMNATSGTCFLWDEEGRQLVPQAWIGYGEWRAQTRHPLDGGIAGQVALRREGLVTTNYPAEPYADHRVLERKHVQAVMGEPLLYRERLIGVLTLDYDHTRGEFAQDERDLLRVFATQAAIAIENARLYTEAQQALTDLHAAQAELVRSEKLRGLGQMAAGIAHDLNNTLAAVLGQVELAKLSAPMSALRETLTCIETAASDGAAVVRRLQEFARPRGTSPLTPCDLGAIVRQALELTRPRWQDEPQRRGRTIAVDMALADDLPLIQGHPPELREALTNLIFNAVDAMPDGGRLSFQARADADTITLTVSDTGAGMALEVQAKIFEPFFTTKGLQGTGLGLAVVYGIMGRQGGNITVSSVLGQGTTFTLTFRRTTDAESAPPTSAPPMPSRRLCLLVVDDEALVRQTIASLLRAIGHDVVEASDGPEAIAALATTSPDAVLTDLGMPGMSGWDLAARIKTHDPSLPVILLTGWHEQSPGSAEERRAVDVTLGKPVRLEELQRVLRDVISDGRRRAPSSDGSAGTETVSMDSQT